MNANSKSENLTESRLPEMNLTTMNYISGTADFLGLNYYTSYIIKEPYLNIFPSPSLYQDAYAFPTPRTMWKRAKSDWLYFAPNGLYDALVWIKDQYGPIDVMITENGWSDDGELNDYDRIQYLESHFKMIAKAIKKGIKIIGHLTWSLLDNFEWRKGYRYVN